MISTVCWKRNRRSRVVPGWGHENEKWKKRAKEDGGRRWTTGSLKMKRKRLCIRHAEEEEEGEDSNNNKLVLSLYSDKFLSYWGISPPAGTRPDDEALPPYTALYMTREPAGAHSGSFLGHAVVSPPPGLQALVNGDIPALWAIFHLSTLY